MKLSEVIIQKIHQSGALPFRDFMEMSLYYPDKGYYTSYTDKIGIQGDYFTSPYFTPIFGDLVARQLEEMWYTMGKKALTVVEYGAGTGVLCRDILKQLKRNKPLFDKLDYCIIEKSPAMKQKEKEILTEKVRWCDSISEVSLDGACVLSNEVVDNFSVHHVVMQDELMEVYVDHNSDGFNEVLKPARGELKEYLKQLNITLPKDFRTEINLEATKWIGEIAQALKKGYVLTVDYGHLSSELYNNTRRNGTTMCYNKHKLNNSLYEYIGEQDITSHVNFSALNHWGFKNGLNYCGYTNQANFLRALGLVGHIKNIEQEMSSKATSDREKLFFIHTLLMEMGTRFKVLVQHKGLDQPKLSGMMLSEYSNLANH